MFTGGLPGQHPGPACKSVGALTASSGRANHGINTTGGRRAIAQAHTGGGGGGGGGGKKVETPTLGGHLCTRCTADVMMSGSAPAPRAGQRRGEWRWRGKGDGARGHGGRGQGPRGQRAGWRSHRRARGSEGTTRRVGQSACGRRDRWVTAGRNSPRHTSRAPGGGTLQPPWARCNRTSEPLSCHIINRSYTPMGQRRQMRPGMW